MRRTWFAVAVVGLLLVGGSLLVRASGSKSGSMSMGTSSMKGDATLQPKLEALERKVCDSFKAQDFNAFKEVVASDAMSADMNGFATPDQMEPMMKDYALESYTMEDFKLIRLDKDAAVLAYTFNGKGTFKGQPMPAGPYYCSGARRSAGSCGDAPCRRRDAGGSFRRRDVHAPLRRRAD